MRQVMVEAVALQIMALQVSPHMLGIDAIATLPEGTKSLSKYVVVHRIYRSEEVRD